MDKPDTSAEVAQSTTRSKAISKRAALWLKISFAILSPLLMIGLLEGIAYAWERKQANSLFAWELVASRRIDWVPYYEPGAGFALMKPGSRYRYQGIPVDINTHGLRSPETSIQKPPGTFRILSLGDSVAMGWGVPEETTYSRRLEALLNNQSAGVRYEVINAGVPGWNLENTLAYLQAKGTQYQPDLILLDLTIANDIKGDSVLREVDQRSPIRWLRANSYLWPFLTIQMRWAEARANGKDRIDVIDPPTEPAKYFPLDPESEQWTQVWNQITAIQQIAQQNHASFGLVIFPLEYQVLDESYSTLAQEVFTEKAEAAGIPVLDMLPVFQQACRDKPGGACELEDRYLFADVWMHPSALGHELTAVELEAFVKDGLIASR